MELCSFLTLDSFITDPLTHEFMRKALLMSSLVAAVCVCSPLIGIGLLTSYESSSMLLESSIEEGII